jgi:four helix bundle protein
VSRDHRKLRVFLLADSLVPRIYSISQQFPDTERFGLQVQLRRCAVSAACNIVEGCARRTTGEYINFLNIAAGSASEARYLTDLSFRLGFVKEEDWRVAIDGYTELAAGLEALIQSLSLKP